MNKIDFYLAHSHRILIADVIKVLKIVEGDHPELVPTIGPDAIHLRN